MKPTRTILALVISGSLLGPRGAFAQEAAGASPSPTADAGAPATTEGPGPAAIRTSLEVTAPVPTEVSVDGVAVGRTPLVLSLVPGTYTVRGERSSGATSTVVIMRAGEPRKIVFPSDSGGPGAWLWLGLGVAAVTAGVVLGVFVFAQSR